jgi:hypothetical protein
MAVSLRNQICAYMIYAGHLEALSNKGVRNQALAEISK